MNLLERVKKLERLAELHGEIINRASTDEAKKVIISACDEFEKEEVQRDVDAIKDTHKRCFIISLLSVLLCGACLISKNRQNPPKLK